MHMSYWITGQSALTWAACQGPSCASAKGGERVRARKKPVRGQGGERHQTLRLAAALGGSPRASLLVHKLMVLVSLRSVGIAYHQGARRTDEWN